MRAYRYIHEYLIFFMNYFQSLLNVGAIVGSLIGGWAIDKFGRKGTIVLCAIPFEIGWLLISCAHHVSMFHAGRIITGLGIGVISLAYPVRHKGLK